jgi:anti-sigma regulatory factor (Ser/Thr protein kinase)
LSAGKPKNPGSGKPRRAESKKLDLSIPGSYEAIRKARSTIADWLEERGVRERAISELSLVLTEICNNAVEHGTASPSQPMRVHAELASGDLRIEIIEGSASEVSPVVEGLMNALRPPSEADERGRGFFLIRSYVDQVAVDTTEDGSLRLRIRKRVAP